MKKKNIKRKKEDTCEKYLERIFDTETVSSLFFSFLEMFSYVSVLATVVIYFFSLLYIFNLLIKNINKHY